MTKKHFEKMATYFGYALRDLENDDQVKGAWLIIDEFTQVARMTNPNFDRDRFTTWVCEVRDRLRDLEGKRIA